MRLYRSCVTALFLAAVCGHVFADQAAPNNGAPPEWSETIELSDDYRAFVTLQWFLHMSKENADGLSHIKAIAKVNDDEAQLLLTRAEADAKADAGFQKVVYGRMCSQPQNLTTVETAGPAINGVHDEIHRYQERKGREAVAALGPDLSAKFDALVRSQQGAGRVGARANATKWLAATNASPAEAVQQLCASAASMR